MVGKNRENPLQNNLNNWNAYTWVWIRKSKAACFFWRPLDSIPACTTSGITPPPGGPSQNKMFTPVNREKEISRGGMKIVIHH